jgi:hypothetical protein
VAGEHGGGVLDERQVGLAVGVQRCGQADDVGVAAFGGAVVEGGREQTPADHRRQRRVGDVDDIGPGGVDGGAALRVGLDADHFDTRLGERHRERQADVSHADDCYLHCPLPFVVPVGDAGRRCSRATDCIASPRLVLSGRSRRPGVLPGPAQRRGRRSL